MYSEKNSSEQLVEDEYKFCISCADSGRFQIAKSSILPFHLSLDVDEAFAPMQTGLQ